MNIWVDEWVPGVSGGGGRRPDDSDGAAGSQRRAHRGTESDARYTGQGQAERRNIDGENRAHRQAERRNIDGRNTAQGQAEARRDETEMTETRETNRRRTKSDGRIRHAMILYIARIISLPCLWDIR